MQSRAQHAYLALRSLSFLPQHADRPVAVLTGTGLRSLVMAYAVKRLVGPHPALCSLCYLSSTQSARSPSLPARACWLIMAVAVESSGLYLSLRLARLRPHHAVCPVAVPTGTGLQVKTVSQSRAQEHLPGSSLCSTSCPKHAACPDRRHYRLGPVLLLNADSDRMRLDWVTTPSRPRASAWYLTDMMSDSFHPSETFYAGGRSSAPRYGTRPVR